MNAEKRQMAPGDTTVGSRPKLYADQHAGVEAAVSGAG
jgi:hypothetical protein